MHGVSDYFHGNSGVGYRVNVMMKKVMKETWVKVMGGLSVTLAPKRRWGQPNFSAFTLRGVPALPAPAHCLVYLAVPIHCVVYLLCLYLGLYQYTTWCTYYACTSTLCVEPGCTYTLRRVPRSVTVVLYTACYTIWWDAWDSTFIWRRPTPSRQQRGKDCTAMYYTVNYMLIILLSISRLFYLVAFLLLNVQWNVLYY